MARYRVRYVSYANEQLSQLPRPLRTAFDARVEDLKDDPYVAGDYNEDIGSYSTTFGKPGIILYVVSDEIATVTIVRVNWSTFNAVRTGALSPSASGPQGNIGSIRPTS